jgi:flavodoxin
MSTKKTPVVYFSHSGNTREIANQIHKIIGGDIFEIQVTKPYPTDYDAAVDQAKRELESNYRPALKTKIDNINEYDVIFMGFPIWWGTYPAPIRSFLLEHDLAGKTILPFCTHGGGGKGRSAADILELCPKSVVLDGLEIQGDDSKNSQNQVSEWLRENKYL